MVNSKFRKNISTFYRRSTRVQTLLETESRKRSIDRYTQNLMHPNPLHQQLTPKTPKVWAITRKRLQLPGVHQPWVRSRHSHIQDQAIRILSLRDRHLQLSTQLHLLPCLRNPPLRVIGMIPRRAFSSRQHPAVERRALVHNLH